eukprot:gene10444-8397_t
MALRTSLLKIATALSCLAQNISMAVDFLAQHCRGTEYQAEVLGPGMLATPSQRGQHTQHNLVAIPPNSCRIARKPSPSCSCTRGPPKFALSRSSYVMQPQKLEGTDIVKAFEKVCRTAEYKDSANVPDHTWPGWSQVARALDLSPDFPRAVEDCAEFVAMNKKRLREIADGLTGNETASCRGVDALKRINYARQACQQAAEEAFRSHGRDEDVIVNRTNQADTASLRHGPDAYKAHLAAPVKPGPGDQGRVAPVVARSAGAGPTPGPSGRPGDRARVNPLGAGPSNAGAGPTPGPSGRPGDRVRVGLVGAGPSGAGAGPASGPLGRPGEVKKSLLQHGADAQKLKLTAQKDREKNFNPVHAPQEHNAPSSRQTDKSRPAPGTESKPREGVPLKKGRGDLLGAGDQEAGPRDHEARDQESGPRGHGAGGQEAGPSGLAGGRGGSGVSSAGRELDSAREYPGGIYGQLIQLAGSETARLVDNLVRDIVRAPAAAAAVESNMGQELSLVVVDVVSLLESQEDSPISHRETAQGMSVRERLDARRAASRSIRCASAAACSDGRGRDDLPDGISLAESVRARRSARDQIAAANEKATQATHMVSQCSVCDGKGRLYLQAAVTVAEAAYARRSVRDYIAAENEKATQAMHKVDVTCRLELGGHSAPNRGPYTEPHVARRSVRDNIAAENEKAAKV